MREYTHNQITDLEIKYKDNYEVMQLIERVKDMDLYDISIKYKGDTE